MPKDRRSLRNSAIKTIEEISKIPEVSLSYAGGLFDGEGCACAYDYTSYTNSKSDGMRLALSLNNTDFRLPLFMHELFGGALYFINRQDKWRRSATWKVQGKKSLIVAEALLPYTIAKKNQLEIFIIIAKKLVGDPGAGWLHPKTKELRDIATKKLKDLKKIEFGSQGLEQAIEELQSFQNNSKIQN